MCKKYFHTNQLHWNGRCVILLFFSASKMRHIGAYVWLSHEDITKLHGFLIFDLFGCLLVDRRGNRQLSMKLNIYSWWTEHRNECRIVPLICDSDCVCIIWYFLSVLHEIRCVRSSFLLLKMRWIDLSTLCYIEIHKLMINHRIPNNSLCLHLLVKLNSEHNGIWTFFCFESTNWHHP